MQAERTLNPAAAEAPALYQRQRQQLVLRAVMVHSARCGRAAEESKPLRQDSHITLEKQEETNGTEQKTHRENGSAQTISISRRHSSVAFNISTGSAGCPASAVAA